ncbi:MAG: class I SAM-dependent methyltransferase [Nitrospirae bacterium]|nr:class I SAM-dependent methyltransferase [Nitrospirota bacterium]MCL5976720.1 class I SAM-dependent methyltransferase [Nitrospirota bacterium]
MQPIEKCRACEGKKLKLFFDFGIQPLANSLLKNPNEFEKSYPLSLSWCEDCNLVQLNHTADPKELFSEYVWVTGTSSTAKMYSQVFCSEVLKRSEANENRYILEVASNDGTFLQPFLNKGFNVLGIDPAQNIVRIANASGMPTICGFFGRGLAREIIDKHGYPQIVIARNVLPHVANLHDFIEGLSLCMDDDSVLALEIHYAKVILEELHYDSIYHEHLCYFSLKSVEKLLNAFSLFVYDIAESPISGGSIVLYAKKVKVREEETVQRYRDIENVGMTNELSSWQSFANRAFQHRQQLLNIIDEEVKSHRHIVGYGASARSSTLLNFCGIDTGQISVIADQSHLKHKRFTPGTCIPIEAPDDVMNSKPDTVFIMAWNFLEEIALILKNDYRFKGRLIIPFPHPPKIMTIEEVLDGYYKR